MPPKQDKDGFYLDDRSNDLEGAAGFQRHWNGHLLEDDNPDEHDNDDEPEDDDEDRCGCSDPCCPCEGLKKGTP